MFRKLIQWLARQEIALAFDAGYERGRLLTEQRERLAYAQGELDGQNRAFDAMDDFLHGRLMEQADIDRARKSWRH